MSDDVPERESPPPGSETPPGSEEAELTSPEGTPVAVDVTRDREARITWVVLLAGPIIWAAHFTVVYLVAEAGCTGAGRGLRRLDPPVPTTVTIVATVVALAACLGVAGWAWRRMRGGLPQGEAADEAPAQHRHRELAFVGLLLALVSGAAVLFAGAPALVLTSC